MTDIQEAILLLREYEFEFVAENAMFGDDSFTVEIQNVFESENEAKQIIEALKTLIYQEIRTI